MAVALALAAVAGCKSDSDGNTQVPGGGSGGSSTGFTFGGTDMYVDFLADKTEKVYMHLDGDWTQPCKITEAQKGSDIACILEVEEMDLYQQGMGLVYNIPTEQCDYGSLRPYYYYSFQPALGPTAIHLDVAADGTTTLLSQTPVSGTNGYATISIYNNSANCSSDYSAIDGPDCCEGPYINTVTTHDSGGGSTTVSNLATWPGKLSACLVGPAMDTQPLSKDGYPKVTVFTMNGTTVHDTYSITAPWKKEFVSNAFLANYFTPPYSLANSPTPMHPPGPIPSTTPWYEFGCLNHAQEYNNRIRVLIREWSNDSDFAAQAGGDPGYYGPEGVPFTDQQIFDHDAWPQNANGDGFGNTYPGFNN